MKFKYPGQRPKIPSLSHYTINLGFWKTATYASPKSTFCPKREVNVIVGLGDWRGTSLVVFQRPKLIHTLLSNPIAFLICAFLFIVPSSLLRPYETTTATATGTPRASRFFVHFFFCSPCIITTWNDQILILLDNGDGKAINSTVSVRTRAQSLLFSSNPDSLLF